MLHMFGSVPVINLYLRSEHEISYRLSRKNGLQVSSAIAENDEN
jgi:hypothetical protein